MVGPTHWSHVRGLAALAGVWMRAMKTEITGQRRSMGHCSSGRTVALAQQILFFIVLNVMGNNK